MPNDTGGQWFLLPDSSTNAGMAELYLQFLSCSHISHIAAGHWSETSAARFYTSLERKTKIQVQSYKRSWYNNGRPNYSWWQTWWNMRRTWESKLTRQLKMIGIANCFLRKPLVLYVSHARSRIVTHHWHHVQKSQPLPTLTNGNILHSLCFLVPGTT